MIVWWIITGALAAHAALAIWGIVGHFHVCTLRVQLDQLVELDRAYAGALAKLREQQRVAR